jgi:integrase/recombinase XerC
VAYYRKRGDVWYYTITDADGRKIQRRGCSTKEGTAAMAAKAENEAAMIRSGTIDPRDVALNDHEQKSIRDHLEDWRKDLIARGVAEPQPRIVNGRVARIIEVAKIERASDITPSQIQSALQAIRDSGVGSQTLHHYAANIKQFSRWLWRDGRAPEDSLAFMTKPNPATDIRHERRAMTPDELGRLFAAAKAGPTLCGIPGVDRSILYQIAAGAGLRVGELGSLEPDSFDLGSNPPSVTIEAKRSKRRRRDVQPIRRDLAETIRGWLKDKPRGEPLFPTLHSARSARMLRHDLEAAGIEYVDDAGRYADFHALRHTFISALARTTAPFAVVQDLARHSDPRLTKRYAHTSLHDQTAALESLPVASNSERPEAKDHRKAE